MRILILGAGVVGSFNAARFKEAGQDVTLLAHDTTAAMSFQSSDSSVFASVPSLLPADTLS